MKIPRDIFPQLCFPTSEMLIRFMLTYQANNFIHLNEMCFAQKVHLKLFHAQKQYLWRVFAGYHIGLHRKRAFHRFQKERFPLFVA